MRASADLNSARGRPFAAAMLTEAANEIEALRKVLRMFSDVAIASDYPSMRSIAKTARALLPPTPLDNARERFEESLLPAVVPAKVIPDEVAAWGREFEASAVRIKIPRT